MVDRPSLEIIMFSRDIYSSYSQAECWKGDFFLHTVALELAPEDLLRHSLDPTSLFFSLFEDKFFLAKLCEKWNLRKVSKFDDFLLLWDSRYLFSEDTSLEYQLERSNSARRTPVLRSANSLNFESCKEGCLQRKGELL